MTTYKHWVPCLISGLLATFSITLQAQNPVLFENIESHKSHIEFTLKESDVNYILNFDDPSIEASEQNKYAVPVGEKFTLSGADGTYTVRVRSEDKILVRYRSSGSKDKTGDEQSYEIDLSDLVE